MELLIKTDDKTKENEIYSRLGALESNSGEKDQTVGNFQAKMMELETVLLNVQASQH